jgi:hypothetical protein
MKKTFLFIVFIIYSIVLHAQGLYFGGSIGYGHGVNTTTPNQNLAVTGNLPKGSFGTGFTPCASVGYLFSRNIGTELGVGYLIGASTYQTKETTTTYNAIGTARITMKSFYINPSLVIKAGKGKIVPYGRLGIFLGLVNTGIYHNQYDYYPENKNVEDKTIYQGGVAIGSSSNLGVDVMLSDKIAVFGELSARIAMWTPGKQNETSTVTDNVTNSKMTSSTGYYNSTSTPFSTIGLNVGVKYYLLKK